MVYFDPGIFGAVACANDQGACNSEHHSPRAVAASRFEQQERQPMKASMMLHQEEIGNHLCNDEGSMIQEQIFQPLKTAKIVGCHHQCAVLPTLCRRTRNVEREADRA